MNTCIEKAIEANIIAAIKALGINGLEVVGTWNVAPDETPATNARLAVKVSPRGYSRYTVSEAAFAASLELSVRVDTDRHGVLLGRASAAILALLHTWNMNKANEAKLALSVPGKVAVGGVHITQGNGPDREGDNWYVSFPMDIIGFIKQTQGE
ncbi:MAG: hypothetical protein IKO72_12300 [Kiritimatiellae bacterium]|nr:hypothetical protein [Kiritimatiellia bacterium]